MIEAVSADDSEVLDLYAGSGALGIEALSRGAAHCTFVEHNAQAAAVIRENLTRARVSARGDVVVARVERWHPPAGVRYTLVLADPPYDDQRAASAIERVLDGALAPQAAVVLEHRVGGPVPGSIGGLPVWRERRHGDGAVAIYRRSEESQPATSSGVVERGKAAL